MSHDKAAEAPEAEKRAHLRDLIAHFETAMLVTRTQEGGMRSRPLAIADSFEDGSVYFATSIASGKVHELEHDPHVNVVMQDGRRFVSISGTAHLIRDRALVDALWSESWRIWFPEGKDDPALCVLAVEPAEADYWDAAGVKGLKYLFQMAKGYVTGTRPPSDQDEDHTGHVKL